MFNFRRKDAPKVTMSGADLLPPFQEYHDKLLCMSVARNDVNTYNKLYYETVFSDVWELYALQRTAEFEPITEERKK